jgi:tetratricopeptide (TPR) repeat protein
VSGLGLAALAEEPSAGETTEFGEEDAAARAAAEARAREEDTQFLDDLAQVEAGSAVNLGEATAPGERPSGRDLIAEAVESGVDLASAAAEPAEGEDEEAVELGTHAAGEGPSSAGGLAGGGSDIASDAEVDLGDAGGEAVGSSAVDLGGTGRKAARRGASDSSTSGIDLGSALEEQAARTETYESDSGLSPVAPDEAEAAAAAVAEGGAEVVEEGEPEGPDEAAPARPRGRRGLVGGAVGALVGVVGCFALWLFGLTPPDSWRLAGGSQAPPPVAQRPGTAPGKAAPTFEDVRRSLNSGDYTRALEEWKPEENNPEQLTAHAVGVWEQYLQQKGGAAKVDDQQVKEAMSELEKAKTPEARFRLGLIRERTLGPDAARETFEKGRDDPQADATWKRVFQTQLDRLEAQQANPAPGGSARAPARDAQADAEGLLVGLLVLQLGQPPQPGQPAGAGQPAAADDTQEAGFEFWSAVKLTHQGKYDDAIKALDAAKKLHAERRYARLRKAQNPLSDPTEEIFLKSCDELKTYWQMRAALSSQGLLAKGADPVKALDNAVKGARQAADTLAAVGKKLGTTPEGVAEAIDKLEKAKQAADRKAEELQTSLTAAKKETDAARAEAKGLGDKLAATGDRLKAAAAELKGVEERLTAAGVKAADPIKGVDQLAAARQDADKTLAAVTGKLEAAGVKVPQADVVTGVGRVVELAKVKDPMGRLAANQAEIKRLEGALAQRHPPEEMLDVWLPVLADRTQRAEAMKAVADAERVGRDPEAAPAAKAKALAVLGLCLRNLGDYASARTTLANALKLSGERVPWRSQASQALADLIDPSAYYLPQAQALYAAGENRKALEVLTEALKVFPKDNAPLLALRGLARLGLAREEGMGKVAASDPAVAEARKDAEAAAAAGSAEGQYALGRIAEETGNLAEARQSYGRALAAHREPDEAGDRYRIALARVLLRAQQERTGGGGRATARGPARGETADPLRHPLASLVLLLELTGQAGSGPEPDEATKLADEVLASPEASFALKAQALAIKGQWTKALLTYAEGLRPHIRRDYADGLLEIVQNHPGLKRRDSLRVADPLLAEAHFGDGLRRFAARRYADAEEDFLAAIEADSQDARYYYYLGLARLAQGKRNEAIYDFEQGARLEDAGRPGRAAVSEALERIQGAPRQTLNRYRP